MIPQASIPEIMPLDRLFRDQALAADANLNWVNNNITLASNTATKVFSNIFEIVQVAGITTSYNPPGNGSPAKIIIQNNSVVAVKWFISAVASDATIQALSAAMSANSYSGILAACSVAEDGLGSILTLPGFKGQLFLFAVGASAKVSMLVGQANQ